MPDLPRPVQVLHAGRWVEGDLEAVNRIGGAWRGLVRYTVTPGSVFLQWRPERELRAKEV